MKLDFRFFLLENNTPARYIITVLSQILKKSEGEISKIVKQPGGGTPRSIFIESSSANKLDSAFMPRINDY